MTGTNASEPMTAVLLQLAGLTGKLVALDERQAATTRQISDRISALAAIVTDLKGTVAAHAEALAVLGSLERRVADLARAAGDGGQPAGYRPVPTPRFWKPGDPGLDLAIRRLRSWVEEVYRPGYDHLAAGLGESWEQHPLCLVTLDCLSEMWSLLYLAPKRTAATLAGQAEWQLRYLPAAAGQLARETRGCPHRTSRYRGPGQAGARP